MAQVSISRFQANLTTGWWSFFIWIPLCTFGCSFLVGIFFLTKPKLYVSQAILEETPSPKLQNATALKFSGNHFLSLDEILQLKLRWDAAPDEIQTTIIEAVSIRRDPGKNQTIISCRHPNKVDARDIVEILSKIYKGWNRTVALEALDPQKFQRFNALNHLKDKQHQDHLVMLDWQDDAKHKRRTELAMKVVDEQMNSAEAHKLAGHGEESILDSTIELYREFKISRNQTDAAINTLENQLKSLSIPPPSEVRIIQAAVISDAPVSSNHIWLQIAKLIGLIVGFATWFLYMSRWRDPNIAANRRAQSIKKFDPQNY